MARTKLNSIAIHWTGSRFVQSVMPKKFLPVPNELRKVKKAVTRRRKKRGKIGPRKKKKAVTKYKVKRLVRRLDDKGTGKRFFEVEWEGYSEIDNTVEPRGNLMLDVRDLVEKYERENGCVLN